jgi:hypothetical protein
MFSPRSDRNASNAGVSQFDSSSVARNKLLGYYDGLAHDRQVDQIRKNFGSMSPEVQKFVRYTGYSLVSAVVATVLFVDLSGRVGDFSNYYLIAGVLTIPPVLYCYWIAKKVSHLFKR